MSLHHSPFSWITEPTSMFQIETIHSTPRKAQLKQKECDLRTLSALHLPRRHNVSIAAADIAARLKARFRLHCVFSLMWREPLPAFAHVKGPAP